MKIEQFHVKNQFTVTDDEGNTFFQSYQSIIVKIEKKSGKVFLDRDKWNYSQITSKYRNLFLGETTKSTEEKIKSGEYILCNLN